jgi:predicted RNA-binding protein with PIN domain
LHWVVDGMNVIGSRPDGWWRDRAGARRRLVADLAALVGSDSEVTVVFDGRPGPGEVDAAADAGVTARFAPGGPNAADHAIVELLPGLGDRGPVTVITSDSALADAVRRAGVAVEGVKAFRGRLLDSPNDPRPGPPVISATPGRRREPPPAARGPRPRPRW